LFTNYVSDDNATCTQDGTKTAVCDRDNCEEIDTVTDEGSKLNHLFTNYVSDGNATCTQDGTKTAVCDRDGCNEKDTIIDTKKGEHQFGEWQIISNPTNNENGVKVRYCQNCDYYETTTFSYSLWGLLINFIFKVINIVFTSGLV